MSERDVNTVSAETLLLDAEAVIQAADLERFSVFGDMGLLSLAAALHIAVGHEDRVTHLILESPIQSMRDVADTPWGRTYRSLSEADWDVYVQTALRVLGGWDAADSAWLEPMAKAVVRWVDRDIGLAYERLRATIDVGELLPKIRTPTLVLRNEPNVVPAWCSQRVAARIQGAQYRQYADPNFGQQADLIREFVAPGARDSSIRPAPNSASVRTILFTDLVGHTEIMRRLGDTAGRELLREHERITRDAIREHNGTEIKTDGDSFMVSFGSVTAAAKCAIELQRAFAARNENGDEPLRVRMGLNAGEPVEEAGDLYGETVILASRIAAQAGAGEIVIPEAVRHLLAGKGFVFADRGEFVPKGFEDAVRLFEVRWQE